MGTIGIPMLAEERENLLLKLSQQTKHLELSLMRKFDQKSKFGLTPTTEFIRERAGLRLSSGLAKQRPEHSKSMLHGC
ncbi:hypothetical protein PVL30_004777 [Lodderomyces elongisporus]|nr:uncharacterized protein PVL30_004768 [Lodderomyces elongisporus]XP_060975592.1 uncharacterized protein PVL30_004772 [Lodderomyces elongisporus]XP_060975596.1 uncharacterized protein PVL30_004777 [Lodderomyces elongisporus]WLF80974.1 hypothetical protein PVL30_004768 [Lodderomyces elongisporus]WLF80978.1 hypothetical protein PVL30_004772 [Lodderomyces elongisporus]WLF80983.1 hypothetical protein PVL30_004777 [Lodderomyces elongisporus]